MSFDNSVDPANDSSLNSEQLWRLPSFSSQASAISPKLLKSIDIYDSNVSASFGDFEGGVIDAKLKDAQKPFAASISTSYTDGNLNKIILDDARKYEFDNLKGENLNNNFVKQNHNIYIESRFSEDYGIVFDYNRTISRIKMPTKRKVLNQGYFYPDQKRVNENFLLRGLIVKDRHIFKPSLVYAPSKYYGFLEGVIDSNHRSKFGGVIASLELFSDYDDFNLTHNLSFSQQDSAKFYDSDMKIGFKSNDVINWSPNAYSIRGGIGSLKERAKEFSYKLDFEKNTFKFANTSHTVKAGLLLKYKSAKHERLKEFFQYTTPFVLPDGYVCKKDDFLCVMGEVNIAGKKGAGQAIGYRYYSAPHSAKVSAGFYDFYLEDDMQYKDFYLRLGTRASYDGIIKRFNIAPRISAKLDITGDKTDFIGAGFNRYYGKNFFAYKLYDTIYQHTQSFKRTHPDEEFKPSWRKKNMYHFHELKRPYTDEFSLFYKGRLAGFKLDLKYLKRKSKAQTILSSADVLGIKTDEFTSDSASVYVSKGKSEADIINLAISRDFTLFNTQNKSTLNATYTKKRQGFKNYRTSLSSLEKKVKYEGRIIDFAELPNWDFYDKFKLNLRHDIAYENLQISNLFSFTPAKYSIVGSYNKDEDITEYRKIKLKNHFSWDMNIAYKQRIAKGIEGFFNINIENLLNTKNELSASLSRDKIIYDYARGRSITLEFGLNY